MFEQCEMYLTCVRCRYTRIHKVINYGTNEFEDPDLYFEGKCDKCKNITKPNIKPPKLKP